VEFREIRKGDRQVLQFLLRRLAEQEEESINEAAELAGI
jgi:predicted transcriptional regulator